MNFIKVSCPIAQAQCLTNWGDWCDHPNRPSSAVLLQCIISFSVFYEIKLF